MSVRKSFLWLLGGNASVFVVQFIASVVAARLLTAAEMGIYAISTSAMWLLNAFQNLGLCSYLLRERELEPAKIGTVLVVSVLQSLLLASLLWFIAPLLAAVVNDARVTHSLRILCLFALASPLFGTLGALFQRRMRFDLFSGLLLLDVSVAAVVTIAGALHGLSYASMPWGAAAGVWSALLVSLWLLRHELRAVQLGFRYWREVWGFGVHMLLTAGIGNICIRMIDIILGRFAGVAATGLYNRGAGVLDVVHGSIVLSMQRLMQPLLVQHRDRLGTQRRAYLRAVRVMTGLLWPAFGGLAVLAGPVIHLLYGNHWVAAAPLLSLLAFASMIDIALCCRMQVLIAAGRVNFLPRIEAVLAIVNLGLFTFGATIGLTAAAGTRIVGSVIIVLAYAPAILRATDVRAGELVRAYAKSLIVAVAAVLPPLLLMMALGWPQSLPPLQLFGAIAAGGLAWLATIYVTGHALRGEIDGIVRALPIPGISPFDKARRSG